MDTHSLLSSALLCFFIRSTRGVGGSHTGGLASCLSEWLKEGGKGLKYPTHILYVHLLLSTYSGYYFTHYRKRIYLRCTELDMLSLVSSRDVGLQHLPVRIK